MIYNSFLFNYLNNRRKDNTKIMRLKILIDLEYDKNQFKIDRLSKRRIETDINELLDDIKFKFEESLVPFKKRLELFNKERIYNDHSLSILKDSSSLCEDVIVRNRRVLNMLKAFNSQVFLGKFSYFDQIYSCDSTFPEEVSEYFSMMTKKI